MRKSVSSLCLIVGAVLLIGSSGLVWAEAPDIQIDLNFDKSQYAYGEPVGVQVDVRNDSGKEILISKGFKAKTYYFDMRVLDPANRLILARRDEFHDEFPDAPPLAYVLYEGTPIRVASCEVLPVGWAKSSWTDDLRVHYPLELPGYYSAQVQLSVMVFKGEEGDPCDVNDYEWLGVLKSPTRYFSIQGDTEGVKVIPDQWHLLWKDRDKEDVEVQIIPDEGMDVEDFDPQSFRLNNVAAGSVKMLSPKIKAHFIGKDVINSLGDVQEGQWYTVMITGSYRTGKPYAREQEIRILP